MGTTFSKRAMGTTFSKPAKKTSSNFYNFFKTVLVWELGRRFILGGQSEACFIPTNRAKQIKNGFFIES
jgi:hypothetical protein